MRAALTAADLLSQAEHLAQSDPEAALTILRQIGRDDTGEAQTDGEHADGERTADPTIAAATYLQARLTALSGDPVSALALIGEARVRWSRAGDDLAAIRVGLGEMHVLGNMGRHLDTLAVGQRMLAQLEELPHGSGHPEEALRWLRAATLNNVGSARALIDEHADALNAFTAAEAEWGLLGLERERAMEQANRGTALTATGRADDALGQFDLAAGTFARLRDRFAVANVDGERADALVSLGRYSEALEVFERSRVTFDELGAETESARLTVQTAATYLRLALLDEAGHLAELVAERCRRAGLEHDRFSADLICGEAAWRNGDLDRATEHLDAAVTGFVGLGNPLGEAEALLCRSRLAAELGRPDRAGDDAERARSLADAADWPPDAVAARLALVDLVPGTPEADVLLEQAGERARELPIPDLHYGIGWRRGRQHRLAGRREEARELLDATLATAEDQQARLTDDRLRRSFGSGRADAQEERLRLALDGDPGELVTAVVNADRARTRTLTEALDGLGRPGSADGALESDPADEQLRATYTELLRSGTQPVPHRRQLLARVERLEQDSQLARLRQAARRAPAAAAREPVWPAKPPTGGTGPAADIGGAADRVSPDRRRDPGPGADRRRRPHPPAAGRAG